MNMEAGHFIKVPVDQVVTIGTAAVVVTAEIEKEVNKAILSHETAQA
jgi:hypothetical protein